MKYFEKLSNTYLAHFSRRLSDLINEQGAEILFELNLKTPSTAISAMLYLDRKEPITVAALAEALGVSHQMATQRINSLEKLLLIKRISSLNDKRSKSILLTEKGHKEVKKLIPFTKNMNLVFDQLELEIGCSLTKLIRKAELSLLENPLKIRLKDYKGN